MRIKAPIGLALSLTSRRFAHPTTGPLWPLWLGGGTGYPVPGELSLAHASIKICDLGRDEAKVLIHGRTHRATGPKADISFCTVPAL